MTVAVVGASGLTGSAFCDIVADKLPRLRLIGKSTVGTRVTLAGKTYVVEGEEALDKSCEYAMFFTDEQTSRRLVPKAALNGAVCIDNSCAFRMHRDVPLVVPKVNGGDVGRCKVIANPNCTAIQIAIALNCVKSLGIEEVTAVTFQAASGAGREGLADLRQKRGYGKLKAFAHPLCDNVIGQIGELLPDGTYTPLRQFVREGEQPFDSQEHLIKQAQMARTAAAQAEVARGANKATIAQVDQKEAAKAVEEKIAASQAAQAAPAPAPTPAAATDAASEQPAPTVTIQPASATSVPQRPHKGGLLSGVLGALFKKGPRR